MESTFRRRSPIHALLDVPGVVWGAVAGAPIAMRIGAPTDERRYLDTIGLCDLSVLNKVGFKGPDVETGCRAAGLEVPSVFAAQPLGDVGWIVRAAADEFFLEQGVNSQSIAEITDQVVKHTQRTTTIRREDATFLTVGDKTSDLLAQTCGVDFRGVPAESIVFSRVAGVSCCVLKQSHRERVAYRFWVDPSYAHFLWTTLLEIGESLGGGAVGLQSIYPAVAS